MARTPTVILLVVLSLLAAITATWLFSRDAPADSAPPSPSAQVKDDAVPVYAHRVTPERLTEDVTATGVVRADESIRITSEISAKIAALEFTEGAQVNAGDLLVKLDDAEIRAELTRAKHRVDLARLQAERFRELVDAQSVPQQQYDEAASEVRVLEAEIQLIEAQLAKTELRAPFAGVVGLRFVSVGSLVSPATPIVSLQKIDPLKVDFAIAERHMASIAPRAPVQVRVAGLEETLEGRVFAIEPQIDPATRTVQLRARINNPGHVLPGAFATVELTLREVPDALLVPATALVQGLNEQHVFVIVDDQAQTRAVKTGIRRARDVQIVEGIRPGDVVITSGQMQLEPGTPVRPVTREEPTRSASLEVSKS